ncbi:MAG: FG-GAP repeat protein [Planctomycetota bacterium]
MLKKLCYQKMSILFAAIVTWATIGFCQVGDDCPDFGPFFCFNRLTGAPDSEIGAGIGRKVVVDGDIALVGVTSSPLAHFLDTTTDGDDLVLASVSGEGGDGFGYSVSIKGDFAAVGAPNGDYIRVIEIDRSSPGDLIVSQTNFSDPTEQFYDINNLNGFGHDVGVSSTFVVAGEPNETPGDDEGSIQLLAAGAAHVFNTQTGMLNATLENPEPKKGDAFGSYVAIEETAASNFNWAYVAISAHQDDNGNGADSGRVYLYFVSDIDGLAPVLLETFPRASDVAEIKSTIPSTIKRLSGIKFGQDTEIKNGQLLVTYTGGAIMYDLTTNGFPTKSFDNPIETAASNSQTGSFDGDHVVIGTPRPQIDLEGSYDGGFVYVYDADSTVIQQIIVDPTQNGPFDGDPGAAEEWPNSIAVDNGVLLTGSPLDNEFGFYTGEVNIFNTESDD